MGTPMQASGMGSAGMGGGMGGQGMGTAMPPSRPEWRQMMLQGGQMVPPMRYPQQQQQQQQQQGKGEMGNFNNECRMMYLLDIRVSRSTTFFEIQKRTHPKRCGSM